MSVELFRKDNDTVIAKYEDNYYEVKWPITANFRFTEKTLESYIRMGGHITDYVPQN